jgi:hypothetical protein
MGMVYGVWCSVWCTVLVNSVATGLKHSQRGVVLSLELELLCVRDRELRHLVNRESTRKLEGLVPVKQIAAHL